MVYNRYQKWPITEGEGITSKKSLAMNNTSIASLFDQYFSVIPADTEDLIKAVYNIRHQVYCEELGFEQQRANRLEIDDYDLHSSHCLLHHKSSNSYAGCVRLVLASNDNPEFKFPFEQTCKVSNDFSLFKEQPRRKFGEISRLAITANFRRRRGESNRPDGGSDSIDASNEDERRRFPSVALGLYIAITAIGLEQGLEGVFAMMEPRLARQLRRFGFYFTQIGDTVEHRGLRAPFFIDKQALFDNLRPEFRELLDSIQTGISSAKTKNTQAPSQIR